GSSLANMLGSLIGGLLLTLGGTWGFAGWQWVFIATGLPAVIVAFVALKYLPNSVSDAPFLSQQEKDVVLAALRREA
ncbi:MFS transporter, partial [Paraburkholderia sp. SIMBA_054]|uniref:MFS transporter n=1 Tax=Paraburkholderia sp. SIMBA_054 TaxID=3085795 RepID=UPI00397DF7FD